MAYRDLSARRRAHRMELAGGDTGDARTLQGHPASDFMLSGGDIPVLYDATGKVIYEQATAKQVARLDYNDTPAAPAGKGFASASWLAAPRIDNTGPNLFGGNNDSGSGTGPLLIGPSNASEVDIGASGKPGRVYSPLAADFSDLNTVFAQYNTSSGQTMTNSASTPVNFNNRIYDSHNAVTTGAGWIFRAPVEGLYLVTSAVAMPVSTGSGFYAYLWLKLNSAEAPAGRGLRTTYGTGATGGYAAGLNLSTFVYCAQNDTLQINCFQYTAANRNLEAVAAVNHVSILRVAGA